MSGSLTGWFVTQTGFYVFLRHFSFSGVRSSPLKANRMKIKSITSCFSMITFSVVAAHACFLTAGVQEHSILNIADVLPEPAAVPQDDEAMDFLMRAPLHEAFAEMSQSDPEPGLLVVQKPPVAIEEMPPEYKPEGDNVIWINGYWYWDDERDGYIWISGVWRDAPVGQRWIAGYWYEEPDPQGFRWVHGFWIGDSDETIAYLPAPPQSVEVGPNYEAPSEDYFYVPGTWTYNEARYVWRPGYYTPYLEGFVWVPPAYIWTPCGYVFRAGYWDRPLESRGVVFAPVYYRQPIYLAANYYYRPRYVIDTSYAILPHLFVRRNRCHYYFGDWYADRYINFGFHSWSNMGNRGFYHRQFDPLYCYYRSPLVRYQNMSPVHWARTQHMHYAQNVHLRPPVNFNLTIINQHGNRDRVGSHRIDHRGGLPQNQAFIADTLERRARASTEGQRDRHMTKMVRLNEQELARERGSLESSRQFDRRRMEQTLAQNHRQQGNASFQPRKIELKNEAGVAVRDVDRIQRDQRQSSRTDAINQLKQKQVEAQSRAQASARRNDGARSLSGQLADQASGRTTRDRAPATDRSPVADRVPGGDRANAGRGNRDELRMRPDFDRATRTPSGGLGATGQENQSRPRPSARTETRLPNVGGVEGGNAGSSSRLKHPGVQADLDQLNRDRNARLPQQLQSTPRNVQPSQPRIQSPSQPERNLQQPQRNLQQPQRNLQQPQRDLQQPQRNLQQPQRNLQQPPSGLQPRSGENMLRQPRSGLDSSQRGGLSTQPRGGLSTQPRSGLNTQSRGGLGTQGMSSQSSRSGLDSQPRRNDFQQNRPSGGFSQRSGGGSDLRGAQGRGGAAQGGGADRGSRNAGGGADRGSRNAGGGGRNR